eukprot:COSAG02_NODE_3836_length_6169_cov_5.195222_2_plen_44_part_00
MNRLCVVGVATEDSRQSGRTVRPECHCKSATYSHGQYLMHTAY